MSDNGSVFYLKTNRLDSDARERQQQLENARIGSCPVAWCSWRRVTATAGLVRARSAGKCRKADGGIIADWRDAAKPPARYGAI